MKLANQNSNLPFESVSKDKFGNDEYGYRTVDGLEEIVHIPTGKSNMQYWKPEKYTHYENCDHTFKVVNMGIREVECINPQCRLLTTFHPAVNFREENGKSFIKIANQEYPLSV